MNTDNENYTKEFQKALNDYIKLGFNQDECSGFIDGFHKGAESQSIQIKERIKELEDVLNVILNAPQPFNENEFISWVATAREEAENALNHKTEN